MGALSVPGAPISARLEVYAAMMGAMPTRRRHRHRGIVLALSCGLVAIVAGTPAHAGVVPGGCVKLTAGTPVHRAASVPASVELCLPGTDRRHGL